MAQMNLDHFVAAIQALACLYIAFRGLVCLNDMGPKTRHVIRIAYSLMTAGAGYGVVNCFPRPDLFTATLAVGFALYFYGDRRHSHHG